MNTVTESALKRRLRTLGHGLLYAVLGAWFIATAAGQDPTRRWSALRKYDPTGLILPDWRFFAPRPGMHDNHVLIRDELADGTLTPWKESASSKTRRPIHILFYPTRRSEKAVTDAASALLLFVGKNAPKHKEDIQLSIAYLSLLNYASNEVAHHPDAVKTQFSLVTATGYDESEEPEVAFLSNLHHLAKAPSA